MTWTGWYIRHSDDPHTMWTTFARTRSLAWNRATLWIGEDHGVLYRWGYRAVRVQIEEVAR